MPFITLKSFVPANVESAINNNKILVLNHDYFVVDMFKNNILRRLHDKVILRIFSMSIKLI